MKFSITEIGEIQYGLGYRQQWAGGDRPTLHIEWHDAEDEDDESGHIVLLYHDPHRFPGMLVGFRHQLDEIQDASGNVRPITHWMEAVEVLREPVAKAERALRLKMAENREDEQWNPETQKSPE